MKKILAIVMTVAMLLSMTVVFASAEEKYHPKADSATAGIYATSAEEFEPVGDVTLQWDNDAATKINLTDGKLDEWASYDSVAITPNNMVLWACEPENMPENWSITAYFVADKDYLYIGFYIVDPKIVQETAPGAYGSADAFQINVDFAGKLGEVIENDPDTAAMMSNTQNIFYSFAYAGDGGSITIQRQCSGDDRLLNSDGPYFNALKSDDPDAEPKDDVVGTTAKTPDGWSAEFRLPWALMYDDYTYKSWLEEIDPTVYIGGVDNKPLTTGIALYYLNRENEELGTKNWHAGTSNGVLKSEGVPAVTWDAYDNGISLILEADPTAGISFTCEHIQVLMEDETEPPTETKPEVEETDPPADDTDEPADGDETDASTEGDTDAPTAADETDAAADGCASVIGASAAILVAAAAAVVLKKKD